MKTNVVLAGAILAAAVASQAGAATNMALLSDGASFKSASSLIDYAGYGLSLQGGGITAAQNNLLTGSPSVWLNDNETRYLFSDTDTTSSVVIDLGSHRSLVSVGATWFSSVYGDRPPTGFTVSLSNDDGLTWSTPELVSIVPASGGGVDLLDFASPVSADLVKYSFGGAGTGPDAGIGISQLFASAVPEPATWALMLVGFGGLGAVMRSRRQPLEA
jgi:hypothetical protein